MELLEDVNRAVDKTEHSCLGCKMRATNRPATLRTGSTFNRTAGRVAVEIRYKLCPVSSVPITDLERRLFKLDLVRVLR